ncbi:hypothetical protein LGR54_10060 [Ancylobacter sp. Lp-2]|uniref:hypothetical protein n=1 Tax=Ancylobacter sp. Lp-2 TaxID=2881339 RepID=UPI001E41DC22|nr:hypothetical protein [Ancylobacter sp. Lp-2]MCB4768948.1 hypothetical protein [Ancylobacter sp. Lp-2]
MGSVVPFPAFRKPRARRDRRREATLPVSAKVVILPAIRITRAPPPVSTQTVASAGPPKA